MPFYTYVCPRCDAETTELRSADDRNKDLPLCYNGDVPCEMEPVHTPVAGYVRNPAVPKRNKQ